MTDWRAGTLIAIVAVVAMGFAWYERSRPSSRIVALVAALTALAVAGRLVFAPVPNVVATTDVAFITGFALGGPPGFVVGALAAPVSNIWLGQGPWTLWQMAGWGMAGLAGAGLARMTGREIGRVWLALACALVGLLYGALLDLSVLVTYGGEQSLDRYAALSARGIPFNVAHAAGNFAIALAAGPALVRMISRYRERMTFRWHPAGALPALVVALCATSLAFQPADARAGTREARDWLVSNQNADGGYSASPGQPSSPAMTTWTALGLESAGVNPRDVTTRGNSLIDYLRAKSRSISSATDLERTILAIEGAGLSSRSFGGRDLVAELAAKRRGDGSWEGQVNITAFGILALRAAGSADAGASESWLRDAQNGNGGWGFAPTRASEADSTGAAMQALAAAGGNSGPLSDASRYLSRSRGADGGWTLAGGVTNSQSTAWAVQGLVAARGPGGVISGGISYLAKRQRADGHYSYSASSDQTQIWVTGQALTAATRSEFPLAAVSRAPKPERSNGDGREGTPSAGNEEGAGTGDRGGSRGSDEQAGSQSDGERGRERKPGDSDSEAGPGAVDPELTGAESASEAAAETAPSASGGMSGAAKAGIGVGGLALLGGAGFLLYRRGWF